MKKLIHISLLSFTLPFTHATEKLMAHQADDAIAHVLATPHERTWMGDLRGYSEDQIKKAGEMLELLYAEAKDLENHIKNQEIKIAEMMDKGFGGLLEEEHTKAVTELNNLKNKLAQVTSAIKNEEVIAGKRYALAIKRAAYSIATIAAITLIYYALDAYYLNNQSSNVISPEIDKTNKPWWLLPFPILSKIQTTSARTSTTQNTQDYIEAPKQTSSNLLLSSPTNKNNKTWRFLPFSIFSENIPTTPINTTPIPTLQNTQQFKETPKQPLLLTAPNHLALPEPQQAPTQTIKTPAPKTPRPRKPRTQQAPAPVDIPIIEIPNKNQAPNDPVITDIDKIGDNAAKATMRTLDKKAKESGINLSKQRKAALRGNIKMAVIEAIWRLF